MISLLKQKIKYNKLFIKDIKKAVLLPQHRGLVCIDSTPCVSSCSKCLDVCASNAIRLDRSSIQPNNITIDLGKCIFCGDCQTVCPVNKISFSNYYKIASTDRNHLLINCNSPKEDFNQYAIACKNDITKLFGRSLQLRQVSAGGCNACEMELNACANINFDMGRFGIEFVASPRHADGIVITGPISGNMAQALEDCYNSIPSPKIVILNGSCAISGGVFQYSKVINREFLDQHHIDLYIPGCPVHPLTFINGLLDFLKR